MQQFQVNRSHPWCRNFKQSSTMHMSCTKRIRCRRESENHTRPYILYILRFMLEARQNRFEVRTASTTITEFGGYLWTRPILHAIVRQPFISHSQHTTPGWVEIYAGFSPIRLHWVIHMSCCSRTSAALKRKTIGIIAQMTWDNTKPTGQEHEWHLTFPLKVWSRQAWLHPMHVLISSARPSAALRTQKGSARKGLSKPRQVDRKRRRTRSVSLKIIDGIHVKKRTQYLGCGVTSWEIVKYHTVWYGCVMNRTAGTKDQGSRFEDIFVRMLVSRRFVPIHALQTGSTETSISKPEVCCNACVGENC